MGNRRIWWGLGIMAAGVCAAWPFRKAWLPVADVAAAAAPQAAPAPLVAVSATPTKLTRAHAEEASPASGARTHSSGLVPLASALDRSLPRRQIVKVDESTPLPVLAADYAPRASDQGVDPRSAVLGTAASASAIAAAPGSPGGTRTYRIRKHDTLDGIAERLLGSRQHADKLLAANADVILVPEILPVGATIVIPDLTQPPQSVVRVPDMGN